MSKLIPVITIDGPSGTGKGTIMQRIATLIAWHMLDSGALYRVLALAAQRAQVDWGSEKALVALANQLNISFKTVDPQAAPHVFLEEEDVSEAIRAPEIGNGASQVGAFGTVRQALLDLQRMHRQLPGLVTDGRDMGTVVFPDADLKIFLDASPEVRADRRVSQLQKRGVTPNYQDILEKINERDKRDRERSVCPLVPAEDAIVIDTSTLSVDEVTKQVMMHISNRKIA